MTVANCRFPLLPEVKIEWAQVWRARRPREELDFACSKTPWCAGWCVMGRCLPATTSATCLCQGAPCNVASTRRSACKSDGDRAVDPNSELMLLCGSSGLSSVTTDVPRCLVLRPSALARDVLKRSRTQHLQMYIPLCMLDVYIVVGGPRRDGGMRAGSRYTDGEGLD